MTKEDLTVPYFRRTLTLFNNYCVYDVDEVRQEMIDDDEYEDYVDTPPTDDQVYNEINFRYENDWEDFWYEIKNYDVDGDFIILSGHAGLWNGDSAGGRVFRDLEEAVRQAVDDMDYVIIQLTQNELHIRGIHHDGTNHWTLCQTTKLGDAWMWNNWNSYYDCHREFVEHINGTRSYHKGFKGLRP